MTMRSAFIDALCEQAALDETIFLLTADLGWSVLEKFATAFPRRYLNVGVAEQNMLGVAAGMAGLSAATEVEGVIARRGHQRPRGRERRSRVGAPHLDVALPCGGGAARRA